MSNLPPLANSQVTRKISCVEHNAAQFQRIVKTTPELLDLVKSLQSQRLFPGLKAMSVTVTGPPALVAKGLDAWPEIYKSSRAAG